MERDQDVWFDWKMGEIAAAFYEKNGKQINIIYVSTGSQELDLKELLEKYGDHKFTLSTPLAILYSSDNSIAFEAPKIEVKQLKSYD